MSHVPEKLLSTAEAGRELGLGSTAMAALKRLAGIKRHRVFLSELTRCLKEHPDFTVRSAPKSTRKGAGIKKAPEMNVPDQLSGDSNQKPK